MMVYYHADRLARAVSYIRRGELVSSKMRESGFKKIIIKVRLTRRATVTPVQSVFCLRLSQHDSSLRSQWRATLARKYRHTVSAEHSVLDVT